MDEVWLNFNKEHDSLPVTSVKLSKAPCMDAFVEPTVGANHILEVNKFTDCPLELST